MTGFVSRAAWGARPPRPGIGKLVASYGTTVHYEGGNGLAITSHAQCASVVRGIQNFHMDGRGWLDIAYTGLVCPHDYVYEGRWVGKRTAAQGTDEGNGQAYALCALLDTNDPLAAGLLDGLVGGVQMLRYLGGAGHGINGHRDWHPTACPRDDLYGQLPAIRVRADQQVPAPQPTPIPPPAWGPDYPEDAVRRLDFTIPLDPEGRGYADVPVDPAKVVGVPNIVGGNPGDGWDAAPATVPAYVVNVGGVARVVVTASPYKNGRLGASLWVVS
jgi:hypothetical protein